MEVYRVVSVYKTYTTSHRFFTKRAAEYNAKRRYEGWHHEALGWDEEDYTQEPAESVRIEVAQIGEWTIVNEQTH